MKELVCKYCKDEFCVNDQCPMRADYCPVPDTPGVCKHEVRVEVKITPRECLRKAIGDLELDSFVIYKIFTNLLAENGYEIVENDNKSVNGNNDMKFVPGQIVSRDDINLLDEWVYSHKETDEYGRECVVCVTEDGLLMVSFVEGEECAAIMLNRPNENASKFFVGQCVNQLDIANSHDWVFDRKFKDHDIHESVVWVTRDRKLRVVFDDQSEEGVVTLNQVDGQDQKDVKQDFFVGKLVNLTDIEKSDAWKLKSFASNPFDTSCSYISKDDKYVVEFAHQATIGAVKEQYYPGMSVHVGRIGESPYWEFSGSSHDLALYAAKDKSMFVAFDRNSDWGVIKRTLADLLC